MSQELVYIELNQTTATSQNDDLGSFTVNLDRPITLNDGDQLGLYKSFIDTTVDKLNEILLEQDIQLNLSFILYTRNWWANTDLVTDMKDDGVFLNGSVAGDQNDYYIVSKNTTPPATTTDMIELSYNRAFVSAPETLAFTGHYQYLDVNNVKQVALIPIPKTGFADGFMLNVKTNIKCINGSFTDITPSSTLVKANMDLDYGRIPLLATFKYDSSPPPSKDFHLTPRIETVSIPIPKGSYAPDTIGELITTELTRIDGIPLFERVPAGSKFLTSGELIGMSNGIGQGIIPIVNVGGFSESDHVCVDSETGKQIFIPVSGGRDGNTSDGSGLEYIIGASQVALTFQDESIYNWEFLHTPYYVGASGTTKQIGIEYVLYEDGGPQNNLYTVVNKYGGIAWTSLTANVINDDGTVGEPFDFWEDVLKFDLSKICVQFESTAEFTFNDSNGTTASPNEKTGTSTKIINPLEDGINTTGGLVTVDATVDKSSDTPFAYTTFSGKLNTPTIISGTFGVTAREPISDILEFPYFRLDIECSAMNKIVGEKLLLKNTFGVIGRYYEEGSFNSGTSADGIPYLHRGEPIVLSSFKVRILQSDGSVPTSLGDKNTIFLQVVKNIK